MAVNASQTSRRAGIEALTDLDALSVAELLSALACEQRIEIVRILAAEELDVGQIADRIGESMANTSQHLMRLRQVGLVVSQREGVRILNRLGTERVIDLVLVAARLASSGPDGPPQAPKSPDTASGEGNRSKRSER
jgi:DNA-binding transcriptional ArsR family regulator